VKSLHRGRSKRLLVCCMAWELPVNRRHVIFSGEGDSGMKQYHATIMIIDDDENDLFLIERAFRKIGVTDPIQRVKGGREAIAYMMGEGKYADRDQYVYPTFILTDLKMPEVDGFDVLEHLKHNPEWAVIPTVVMTSSRDPDDIKKAYMLGASSYHVKPASPEALRKQLQVLHDYWKSCETPEVDRSGRRTETKSVGKLGERFAQTDPIIQKMRRH
jgi:CheY-like chemotaxis protein